MKYTNGTLLLALVLMAACARAQKEEARGIMFKDDLAFLRQHTQVLILSDGGGLAQVAVNPDLQGRVMTSTAGGPEGLSFGWINRELLASKQNNVHMNAFGGEDRFWLGPEGGQFSIFFKKGDPFDLEHWFTPPPINEGAYAVEAQDSSRVHFKKAARSQRDRLKRQNGGSEDADEARGEKLEARRQRFRPNSKGRSQKSKGKTGEARMRAKLEARSWRREVRSADLVGG